MRPKLFSWHCFTHFPKTTAPQHIIFSGKLSTIIIFKLWKFSINLFFLSYKKYIHPLTCCLQTRCLLLILLDPSSFTNYYWHSFIVYIFVFRRNECFGKTCTQFTSSWLSVPVVQSTKVFKFNQVCPGIIDKNSFYKCKIYVVNYAASIRFNFSTGLSAVLF